jgi:lipoate-protein ligase A
LTIEEFKSILQQKLSDEMRSTEIVLTGEDLRKIEEAAKSKFMSWEWTYGETPQFNYRSDKRFSAGKIGVLLQIKNGLIKSCTFYGDYLALTDSKPLSDRLVGLPYEENAIEKALATEDLELYFGPITSMELLEVFFDHN